MVNALILPKLSAASATFQPDDTSHKIFFHSIKIQLLFKDATTNTSRTVTTFVLKKILYQKKKSNFMMIRIMQHTQRLGMVRFS